ncbi:MULTISPECIES: alpha,alpha-phosphotrehalase [unclassified Leuconostoc]|uniref:alpha,alpha-phosphotrehalase n=1 Tax=unclassified Leuconostoc TaxID=2685106 RepID=UPI001906FD62|nr:MULTISPECIES: alpha,alpha-phosphotrehalase [unclassified Leuconostoc]MBK0040020.1 alpha,alpha-phosphotrehalase [Leuconostoc sp. S51]MBK0050978.1 alpha,alpha-phosphotrehalase [Leuconostoc sp. S50]
MQTEKWWQKAVVYQVYPKSFQDSNHDGIGDIRGIIQRLDYIKQLGVDVIWLNPIYKSPDIDGGYDISDYQDINPTFGSMADFDELLSKAHAMGLKIIMDLVVNHSSSQHDWFQKSLASSEPDNDYRDYYVWRDPVDGHEPNNWGSFFSGPAWTYDEKSGQYYLHLFAKEQPDLNWNNPKVRHSIFDMMNWWAAKGIDGFRMDVISLISKPDGLPDAPITGDSIFGNAGDAVANGPHVHEYLKEMNTKVLSKHDWMTVGETAGVTISEAQKYANKDGSELNMVFEFEHVGLDSNTNPALGKWSDRKAGLPELRENLVKWQQALSGKAWNSLYWNNHDQPRVVSRFGNDSPKFRELSAKMLAALLHFMQGTPYIYQGEELGMTNAYFDTINQYQDLETINAYQELVVTEKLVTEETMLKYFQSKSRDNARTPMQWDTSSNAGFSDTTPWLETNPNYQAINAKAALDNPDSIFYFYQKLIKLRHQLPVITDGTFKLLPDNEQDDHIFAYTRTNSETTLLIIANFTSDTITRNYDVPKAAQLLIQNYTDDQETTIRPYEVKVYQYPTKSLKK